jgi:hypothetical protein
MMIKWIDVCLFLFVLIVGGWLINSAINQKVKEAYDRGYDDGMVSISPDYCLKEFSRNDKPKFRYIQRQYCKGISK